MNKRLSIIALSLLPTISTLAYGEDLNSDQSQEPSTYLQRLFNVQKKDISLELQASCYHGFEHINGQQYDLQVGTRLNPYWRVGIGVSAYLKDLSDDGMGRKMYIPIYANIKCNITDSPLSPYIACNLGTGALFSLDADYRFYGDIRLGIDWRFGNSSIFTEATASTYDLLIGVGYSYHF